MRKRKTVDEYQLWVKYESGWEEVTASDNVREIRVNKVAYLKNDKFALEVKVKKVRIKIV